MDFDVLKKELAEHKVYTAWQFIENTNANIRVAQYCLWINVNKVDRKKRRIIHA